MPRSRSHLYFFGAMSTISGASVVPIGSITTVGVGRVLLFYLPFRIFAELGAVLLDKLEKCPLRDRASWYTRRTELLIANLPVSYLLIT